MGIQNKHIEINGQKFSYQLRRIARVKHVRLTIQHDGAALITTPKTYPMSWIAEFIHEKWPWIVKNIAKQKMKFSLLALKHSAQEIERYKKITRLYVDKKLKYYNQAYNYEYNRVAIRNQSTRWGSCSSAKNLNFNYRLCLLPPDLADYIIVHELCHLDKMNHSQAFWALVAKTFPDYKEKEKQLKKFG